MRRVLTWGGVLVSGVFVWLALRDVDFATARDALRGARWWLLLPALLALAAANAVRAWRWQALFERETRPPIGSVTRAMLIGLLFNSILPARAGEPARVLALYREAGTSRAESLATAVAERVYDVLALLVLLLVASPFLPAVSWLGKAAVGAAVVAAAIAAAVFVLARWQERPLVWLLQRLARFERFPLERGERAATNVVQGFASFRRPGIAARGFALTTVSWLVIALSAWGVLAAFDSSLGFRAGLLATIASSLVLVVPAAPGGVGQFEAATIVALSVFGVQRSVALSYGVVLHALNLLPYLAAGYAAMQHHALHVRRRRAQG